ncbi:unnamed protein product [Microthlaspi erraticum]|uniref:Protein MIZU-KUSSEI 1 n=1 Tax=Microthlaspi erraticum TaxID=1685480 RepID=A0A6D2JJ59_9BRAS|nr:unnamed protein product [Microthlaspi erraticum]
MRTMVDFGKQRDHHHLQIITTPTTVDCARDYRLRRTLRSLIECMLPYCCTYQQPSPSYQNDTVSVSSSTSSSSSSDHSSSSTHSNTIVSGTFFGHRRGRVSFCLQDAAVGSPPLLLLELAVPTAALAKEMDQAGVLRIALECDRRRSSSSNSRSSSIFDVPVWSMCCNGKKMGFAVRRKVTENDAVFLRMMQSVSVGAGVVPLDEEEQTLYLRARFERVTGSSDSESFHMMNPGGSYGQELSIFLLRS